MWRSKVFNKMIDITNENSFLRKIDDEAEYRNIQIKKQKEKLLLVFKEAIKTKIRRENDSRYNTTNSREIKKWFETRRI